MGFDLEITFQGMCTFVPERDGSGLWLLMGDRAVRNGDEIPAHAAAISFSLENLVPGTPGFGLRRLDNHDVRIAGQPKNGVTLKGFNAGTNSALGAQGADSFAWISPLEEACASRGIAGGGVIDSDFLRPIGTLKPEHVDLMAARFLFTDGTIGTKKLAGYDGKVLESVFRPPNAQALPGDLRRPTAATVVLNTFIDADSVTFETTRLQTGGATRPLTLRPTGLTNKLSVTILNEEADALVGLQGEPIQLGQARAQDLIFLSMFDFCRTPPGAAQRPMPIPGSQSTLFSSSSLLSAIILDGAPPCSPGRGVL